MAGEQLKSPSITNLDASPVVANTRGLGGPGEYVNFSDWTAVTTTGLGNTASTYKMLRLPSNAKLKAMNIVSTAALDSNGSPALAVDIGAYYSDSTTDGTQQSLAGTAISVNCFLAAVLFGAAATLKVDALQAFSVDKRMQELWQALGLSSDPLGYIDIVVAVHTIAATAVAGKFMLTADTVV